MCCVQRVCKKRVGHDLTNTDQSHTKKLGFKRDNSPLGYSNLSKAKYRPCMGEIVEQSTILREQSKDCKGNRKMASDNLNVLVLYRSLVKIIVCEKTRGSCLI